MCSTTALTCSFEPLAIDPSTTRRLAIVLIAGLIVAAGATFHYAAKSWRSFSVLHNARSLSIPQTGNLRAWMTIDYIGSAHGISPEHLLAELGFEPGAPTSMTLLQQARELETEPLQHVKNAQSALAGLIDKNAVAPALAAAADDDSLTDWLQALAISYGMPIVLAIVFLGAFGLPLPSTPVIAVTGALGATGELRIETILPAMLAVAVAGDGCAYLLGRWLGAGGGKNPLPVPWINPRGWQRADRLLRRWGAFAIVLSRSLIAQISLLIGLMAGMRAYDPRRYIFYSFCGRVIWLAVFFGIGFTVGADFEFAVGFLGYLSLTIIAVLTSTALSMQILQLARIARAAPAGNQ